MNKLSLTTEHTPPVEKDLNMWLKSLVNLDSGPWVFLSKFSFSLFCLFYLVPCRPTVYTDHPTENPGCPQAMKITITNEVKAIVHNPVSWVDSVSFALSYYSQSRQFYKFPNLPSLERCARVNTHTHTQTTKIEKRQQERHTHIYIHIQPLSEP